MIGRIIGILASIFVMASLAAAQAYTFTYQGKLLDGGVPANGQYDIKIVQLEDIAQETGSESVIENVQVTNGIFTVTFSTGALFLIEQRLRFIEIAIRPGSSEGPFVALSPRQPINSVPYAGRSASAAEANYAVTAATISGVLPIEKGGTGSETQNFVDLTTDQTVAGNKTFTGSISGNGAGITNISGANIAQGTITTEQLASGTLTNEQRSKQLGQLRWDQIKGYKEIAVGLNPLGIAFDGKHLWISSRTEGHVRKLSVPDGNLLATFPTGTNPRGVTFDGSNIWIANSAGSLTKLRASDGANLGVFDLAGTPYYMAFDGENIWVTLYSANQVAKVRAGDGVVLGTFAVGVNPGSIAFDGRVIWVSNYNGGSYTRINAADGNNLGTTTLGGRFGGCVVFDGANIWIGGAVAGPAIVRKIRASTNQTLNDFPSGGGEGGCAFDGSHFWLNANGLAKRRISDFTRLDFIFVGDSPVPGPNPVFDGVHMWALDPITNKVTRVPAFPEP